MVKRKDDWSDQEWVEHLEKNAPRFDEALEQLREILFRSLRKSFSGKMNREVLEDLTQDSLVRILEQKKSFKGQSRFLTWAVKVAVNLTLTELRRKRWQDVSMEDLVLESPLFDTERMNPFYLSPEKKAMRRLLVDMVNRMMKEELSEKQQTALRLVFIYGMPFEEAALRMGTNRNALYKLLHDARKRLKEAMEKEGMDRMEVMTSMMMVFSGTISLCPVVYKGEAK